MINPSTLAGEGQGILNKILIIGSWCLSFYQDYFKGTDYRPIIKTRDIDFVVPLNPKFPLSHIH